MKNKKLNKYIVNKLNKLMLRSYSVLFEDMTDEHGALGKQNLEEKMASYKHCNQCKRIYLPSDYEIKNKLLETLKKN